MQQQNALCQPLAAGEPVFGARAKTHAPALIEVYGSLGLDFVWLDFEHGGPSPADAQHLEHCCRAAAVGDTELLVRLPKGEPTLVRKLLDTGVRNVLIPRVEDVDDIQPALKAARFDYDGGPGQRGFAGARVSGWGDHPASYARLEDENVLVGAQIESLTGLENLSEILALPALGFVQIGHGDLAISMGRPMQADHEDVQAAISTILEHCLEADVPVGRVPADVADAREARDAGYQILRLGDEVEGARSLLTDRLDALKR